MLNSIRNKKMKLAVKNYQLYILLIPAVLYFCIFHYAPIYGVQIAFKDFMASEGIWGSPWVGFKHFRLFFSSYYFADLIKNTLGISVYSLIAGFPMPILLALMLNEIKNLKYKKLVQTITYAPHFISEVVMVGIIIMFLHPSHGPVNTVLKGMGMNYIDFMNKPEFFKSIYVWSGIWQSTGWGSIIYFAVLSSVDPAHHEAATIDGATRLQKIWYINLPALFPTAVILLILNAGRLMSVGFEKVYLMQTPLNMVSSDVISTYIYRVGLQGSRFSFTSAIGFFDSIINFILLVSVNTISKKITRTGLW